VHVERHVVRLVPRVKARTRSAAQTQEYPHHYRTLPCYCC
jgi:hypothetical protein